jgi:Putative prokaryotic signal transducing protein
MLSLPRSTFVGNTGAGGKRAVKSANGLVVVLETNDRIQFAMAKGLLEDAGIPLFIEGQIATLYQGVDGFLRKWIRLQVPGEHEAEARELLERFQPAPWRVK